MACLRLILIKPRPGSENEVQRLMEELDGQLGSCEGLVLSFVTRLETNRLGRVSLWHSKDAANREAHRDHILSLRSRLRVLSLATEEVLLDVKSGHVPRELTQLLAGDLDIELPLKELIGTEVA